MDELLAFCEALETSALIRCSMEKTYRISYKTYQNDRLKKVNFHGKMVHPLYIQVTFDRKTTFYKSNFFDLFSKPKYAIRVAGETVGPKLQVVIEKENDLIDFIIDKHKDDFSLDLFKQKYNYYSQDLLDLMEPGFQDYLYTFFHDEGMPALADALKGGAPERPLYDVVEDMRMALKPDLYKRLVENSFYYAPPYLVFYGFAKRWRSKTPVSLTVKDWQDKDFQEDFVTYTNRSYPGMDLSRILEGIEKYEKVIGGTFS